MPLRPKYPTTPQLARVGISIVRRWPLTLRCQCCGAEWQAQPAPPNRRSPDYWKCDNGCNRDAA
jgi:hypothetical protein